MRNQNKELYEEAVERNILNLERKTREAESAGKTTKYAGKDLKTAKMMLGVQKDDENWDNRILKLCKESATK